jgi:uncharacterized membrane protein
MPLMINYWPLLGVAVVVLGFALRVNPALVVVIAGIVSGLLADLPIPDLLALLGNKFIASRKLLVLLLTLPTIGLLERAGLREQAHALVARMQHFTFARLLIAYLAVRQLLSMLGLTGIAGHPQTVRPLLAPMAEAAAEKIDPNIDAAARDRVKALAAGTDNIGLFFGEDVFIAFGAVLLIQGFYQQQGIMLDPRSISIWALPTAIAAFAIHSIRVLRYQRALRQAARLNPGESPHAEN